MHGSSAFQRLWGRAVPAAGLPWGRWVPAEWHKIYCPVLRLRGHMPVEPAGCAGAPLALDGNVGLQQPPESGFGGAWGWAPRAPLRHHSASLPAPPATPQAASWRKRGKKCSPAAVIAHSNRLDVSHLWKSELVVLAAGLAVLPMPGTPAAGEQHTASQPDGTHGRLQGSKPHLQGSKPCLCCVRAPAVLRPHTPVILLVGNALGDPS